MSRVEMCPGQLLCKISYSYLFYTEMHFISSIDVIFLQNQWNVKCRLRAVPDHSWCFKSLSRIITIQGFILPIITGAKKYTISRLVNFLTT